MQHAKPGEPLLGLPRRKGHKYAPRLRVDCNDGYELAGFFDDWGIAMRHSFAFTLFIIEVLLRACLLYIGLVGVFVVCRSPIADAQNGALVLTVLTVSAAGWLQLGRWIAEQPVGRRYIARPARIGRRRHTEVES